MRSPPTPIAQHGGQWLAVSILVAIACMAPGHRAAAADAQTSEAALGALKLAQLEYRNGNYAEAARLFHRAYDLDPVGDYLFNAARAEQRVFDLDAADRDFARFLALPSGSDEGKRRARLHLEEVRATRDQLTRAKAVERKAVEARLRAEAEARQAAEEHASPTPTAPPPAATAAAADQPPAVGTPAATEAQVGAQALAPMDGSWKRPAGWAALGAGVLAAAAGAWLWLSVEADQRDLDARTADQDVEHKVVGIEWPDYERDQTRLNQLRPAAQALTAVGVVAAGLGGWWLATAPSADSSAAIGVGPGRLRFTLRF
mgnify:CR=1 FL=1